MDYSPYEQGESAAQQSRQKRPPPDLSGTPPQQVFQILRIDRHPNVSLGQNHMVYLRWTIVNINRVTMALVAVMAITGTVVVVRVVARTRAMVVVKIVVRVKGVKGADAAWLVRNFCQRWCICHRHRDINGGESPARFVAYCEGTPRYGGEKYLCDFEPFSKTWMFIKNSPNNRVATWIVEPFSVVMLELVVNLINICNDASMR